MIGGADTVAPIIYAGSGTLACSIQAPGFMGNTIRTAMFAGVKYVVDTDPIDGCCSPPKPSDRKPILRVCRPLNTQVGLTTLIHEAMHASNYSKHEITVDRASKEIGRLLWRLGYRRPVE